MSGFPPEETGKEVVEKGSVLTDRIILTYTLQKLKQQTSLLKTRKSI